ncbi:MAG TPA: PEGA domain-containing protein [Vicinamibacterales bacterium]|nr:PEGA domain-containing protein [Vicinamibacterales bacterium]
MLVTTNKIPHLKPVPPPEQEVRTSVDGLEAFQAEGAADVPPPRERSRLVEPLILVLLTAAALGASGLWAYKAMAISPAMASLSIQTTPAGARVTIDGTVMGHTPTAMSLPAGSYAVLLTTVSGQQRQLEVTLRPGDTVVQQYEWAEPAPSPVPTGGALHVQTEPAGQPVFVDDVQRGVSPVTLTDLSPGDHAVHVTSNAGTVRRQVRITAGETLSLMITPTPPAVSAGWLRISSPVLLQLHVGGNLVGDSESDRIMLPSGEHDVQISNESLGYAVTRRVAVAAGRTAQLQITPPNGRLSINALPWAEVWLNGERVGETPIANLTRPIGTHDVILRHPQFGERRARLTVSLKETARLGIDMRQP